MSKISLTNKQVEMIKRLEEYMPQDGIADECHEYYCPYNIHMCDSDENGNVNMGHHYQGKNDGFDSNCPRFFSIDRKIGKYDCLCGLDIVAGILGVDVNDLYKYLRTKTSLPEYWDPVILGFDFVWRKNSKR